MAGIIFPVIIHWWNNRQGKVLPIGSIRFLEQSTLRTARRRKLSEWWLLLLRCLLLLLLALLLAGPRWRRPDPTKGWVLVSPDSLSVVHRRMVDSLIKAGYKQQVLGSDHWRSFAALDQQASGNLPFYIFSDGRAAHFYGSRPVTARKVYWYVETPEGDPVSNWVEKAWQDKEDSVRVLTVSSRATGSSYRAYEQDIHVPLAVPADTTVVSILVYTDKDHVQDGRRLLAAIHSIQQFSRRRIRCYEDRQEGRFDWVCWLSAKPVPVGLEASHWLRYDGIKEMEEDRDFPFRVANLLFPEEPFVRQDRDRRVLDPEQVPPVFDPESQAVVPVANMKDFDLGPVCWCLVMLLCVLERIFSHRINRYVTTAGER